MKFINGKKIADKILRDLQKRINKKNGLLVAIILINDNPVSRFYLNVKEKKFKNFGIRIKKYIFKKSVSQHQVLKTIDYLNKNKKINGILIELPLPSSFSASEIISHIIREKDIDGCLLKSKFQSPFLLAIWQALKATKEKLKNKKIVCLVKSKIFGEKLKNFFKKKGLELEYVLVNNKNFKNKIKKGDVLITALGEPAFIKKEMIKKGAIIIDGGFSIKRKKIMGDVDIKSVAEKCTWLTPVPEGIGPLTLAFLIKNIFLAAGKIQKRKYQNKTSH